MNTTFSLWFTNQYPKLELLKTEYTHSNLERKVSVRGTANLEWSEKFFKWTPAVQAMSILLLKVAAHAASGEQEKSRDVCLKGYAKSPAASLDYALNKQPKWLLDMFGRDADGSAIAKQIFLRQNSERKRPGPVTVWISFNFLPWSQIKVYLDDTLVSCPDQLLTCVKYLEQFWDDKQLNNFPSASRPDLRLCSINSKAETKKHEYQDGIVKSDKNLSSEIQSLKTEFTFLREALLGASSLSTEKTAYNLPPQLDWLRQSKAMFLPAGNESHDKLMLDLFNHQYRVDEVTLFCRPTIHSHPIEILKKLGASENKIKRTEVVLEGYKSGRVSYTEILNRSSIWALLRFCPDRGFVSYASAAATEEDVLFHLDYLMELVGTGGSYKLMLTDFPFSFVFGLFEIYFPLNLERFALLGGNIEEAIKFQPSSFLINDSEVNGALKSAILGMVLGHSSTVGSVDEVLEELRSVRRHLLDKGPIHTPDFRQHKASTLDTEIAQKDTSIKKIFRA